MSRRSNSAPPGADMPHIAARVSRDTVARLDALVSKLAPPGIKLCRSDILRAAIAHGLDVMERPLPSTVDD